MNLLTQKLKNISLTSRILLGTVATWFAGTALLFLWLRFNWLPFTAWLLG